MEELRKCRLCKKSKLIEEFKKTRIKKDGTHGAATACRVCENLIKNQWKKRNPDKYQKYEKIWRDGIGRFKVALMQSRRNAKAKGYVGCLATSEEISSAFTGKCDVCGIPERECNRKHCMDHDHKTGDFRGWLCDSCNKALGHLKNSKEIIFSLAVYLEKKNSVMELI